MNMVKSVVCSRNGTRSNELYIENTHAIIYVVTVKQSYISDNHNFFKFRGAVKRAIIQYFLVYFKNTLLSELTNDL